PHPHRRLRSFAAAMVPGAPRIRGERVECLELHLAPSAAYALLGVPPRELDGTITGLDDLWGRPMRRLRDQLHHAATWPQRHALMDEFLISRATRKAPTMAPHIAAAWERIITRRGRIGVGELAAYCGCSRKKLWAGFTAQVGITPKRAAMLVRFDHAAQSLAAGDSPAEVAVTCGYVDQPHLHRDVLAFAGCTPGALAAATTSAN
ncbi:helix-turn-helix domain-containing protein, partial [Streptomyces sp. A7024]